MGVKGSTGEIIVGDQNGVWVTRTVKRKPVEERWDRLNIERIVAVPWKKNKDDEEADGEDLRAEVKVMDEACRESMQEEPIIVPVPRRICLGREDLEKYGYTVNCRGCVAILKGTARQAHREACRRILETDLQSTTQGRAVDKRVNEYLEKALQKDEEAKAKRGQTGEDKEAKTEDQEMRG